MNKPSLAKTDIKHMLKLEELFYNRFLNQELLNELISLYVKTIDSCNDKLGMMKIYFLQKIQFLVSRPEIERLLTEKQSDASTKDKYTIKMSKLQMDYKASQYVRKSSLHSQPVSINLADIKDENQKIKQRDNRIEIQMQMMREIEQNANQISLKLKRKQSNNQTEKFIKNIDFDQECDLKDRLVKRDKKLRKNSDNFETKKELSQILQSQPSIHKEYLISAHKQLTEKLDRLHSKTGDFNVVHQVHDFKRGRIKLKSIFNHLDEDFQILLEKTQSMDSVLRSQRNRSQLYASFAPADSTPQFSEESYSNSKRVGFNEFQQPSQHKVQLMKQNRNSEYEFREDDYF